MHNASPIHLLKTTNPDPVCAVRELADQLKDREPHAIVFFSNPSYEPDILSSALKSHFACPIIGCTTAGEILSPDGYCEKSIVAVAFSTPKVRMTPIFIPSLSEYAKGNIELQLQAVRLEQKSRSFALLLIDGLSMLEERVLAFLSHQLRGIPLIGGSAGDGLHFGETRVYYDGKFTSDAAVIGFFETDIPFKTFQIQHFNPTDIKMVITEANVSTRTVMEINGLPAAVEYARIVGCDPGQLSETIFASNPLLLRVGGKYYVRSIQSSNPDGSLTFYCAIDNGLVLTLGKPTDIIKNIEKQLITIQKELSSISLIIGCDCILRRIEFEHSNLFEKFRKVISPYPFIGFNTYGEQISGIHVNQTLTGIALGSDNE
jgi:hypothetical protein